MSRADERRVSELLNRRLPIEFTGRKYRMPWGEADDYAPLNANATLILEVERSQNHPATNVLKLWPLLLENPDFRIILAHAFFPDSRGRHGSRRLLTDWVAKMMGSELRRQFTYCRLLISDDFRRVNGIGRLKHEIKYHRGTKH